MKIETISVDAIYEKETQKGKKFWVVKSGDVSYFVWSKSVAAELEELKGKEAGVKVNYYNPDYTRIEALTSSSQMEAEKQAKETSDRIVEKLLDDRKLKFFVLKTIAPALPPKPEEAKEFLQAVYDWVKGEGEKDSEEEEVVDIDKIDI